MPQEVLLQVVFRCPVTDAYTRYVRKWTAFDALMHEAVLGQLQQVEEAGERAGNRVRAQQLRCFLCIEIMMKLSKRRLMVYQRFERSWAGLSSLRAAVVSEYEELEVDTLDRAFGGMDFGGMEQVTQTADKRAKRILQLIEKSCVLLRRSLRNGSSHRLWTIGKSLARACKIADELPSKRVAYAEMLVNTTEEQARRLWEQ